MEVKGLRDALRVCNHVIDRFEEAEHLGDEVPDDLLQTGRTCSPTGPSTCSAAQTPPNSSKTPDSQKHTKRISPANISPYLLPVTRNLDLVLVGAASV